MLPFVASPPAVIEAVVSARQEVRARTAAGERSPVFLDTDTTPSATLLARTRETRVWLTYAPLLSLRDINQDASVIFLNNGTLGATRTFRHGSVTLREDASYGRQNFAGAPLTLSTVSAQPVLSTLPAAQTIGYVSSQTTLSGAYNPTRRWALRAYAAYALSGGTDVAARAVLPLLQGPVVGADVGYSVTRRQALLATAAVQESRASTGARSTIAALNLGWSYLVDVRTTAAVTAGIGVISTRPTAADPSRTSPVPVASASVAHRAGAGGRASRYTAVVGVNPFIDRLTGAVAMRVDGSIAGQWPLTARTTFNALGAVGRSFAAFGQSPTTTFIGETSVGHAPRRWVRFDAGIRGSYQSVDRSPPGAVSPTQAALFVAVTATDTIVLAR